MRWIDCESNSSVLQHDKFYRKDPNVPLRKSTFWIQFFYNNKFHVLITYIQSNRICTNFDLSKVISHGITEKCITFTFAHRQFSEMATRSKFN